MQLVRKINPVARAVAVIGSVMVLATGATYAAFVDSVTLTGNSFTTASATADLNIYNGAVFADTAPGFNFGDLEIGEESERKDFYLENVGNIPLYVTASIPEDDTTFNDINPAKVIFTFYGECTDAAESTGVSATMAQLQAGELDLPCAPLDPGARGVIGQEGNEANYQVSVRIASDAIPPEGGDTPESDEFTILFNGYSTAGERGGDPDLDDSEEGDGTGEEGEDNINT